MLYFYKHFILLECHVVIPQTHYAFGIPCCESGDAYTEAAARQHIEALQRVNCVMYDMCVCVTADVCDPIGQKLDSTALK